MPKRVVPLSHTTIVNANPNQENTTCLPALRRTIATDTQ